MLHDALVALAFPFVFLLVGAAQLCIIDFLYRRDEPWPPMTQDTFAYGTADVAIEEHSFSTIEGQRAYLLSESTGRLVEVVIEGNGIHYMLYRVEAPFPQGVCGFPQCYAVVGHELLLHPTPDRAYTVFFRRARATRGPNYNELSRITREAFAAAWRRAAPVTDLNPQTDQNVGVWPAAAQTQWDYTYNTPVQLSQAAHGKALDLLREWLTPAQLADFKAHNCFFVHGNATGTRYRIRPADSYFNVDEMNTDTSVKQRLCFVCENQVAPGDTMLAQKVMLEQNELHALQIANKTSTFNYADAPGPEVCRYTLTASLLRLAP